jgi:hypothetical protein
MYRSSRACYAAPVACKAEGVSPLTRPGEGRGAMRKKLLVLLAMGALLLATAVPAFAARPDCLGTNCGASPEHRADASGEGNFGQCHKAGAISPGQSSEFNPSPQNTGEADCRTVEGREDSALFTTVVQCPSPGDAAFAEQSGTLQGGLTVHTLAQCPG